MFFVEELVENGSDRRESLSRCASRIHGHPHRPAQLAQFIDEPCGYFRAANVNSNHTAILVG
jgi:hypothetical protein